MPTHRAIVRITFPFKKKEEVDPNVIRKEIQNRLKPEESGWEYDFARWQEWRDKRTLYELPEFVKVDEKSRELSKEAQEVVNALLKGKGENFTINDIVKQAYGLYHKKPPEEKEGYSPWKILSEILGVPEESAIGIYLTERGITLQEIREQIGKIKARIRDRGMLDELLKALEKIEKQKEVLPPQQEKTRIKERTVKEEMISGIPIVIVEETPEKYTETNYTLEHIREIAELLQAIQNAAIKNVALASDEDIERLYRRLETLHSKIKSDEAYWHALAFLLSHEKKEEVEQSYGVTFQFQKEVSGEEKAKQEILNLIKGVREHLGHEVIVEKATVKKLHH
jgi:hypothetical protein